MATKSFFEDMVIDTEDAAKNLDRAFFEADHGINRIDTSDLKGLITDEDELRDILGWRYRKRFSSVDSSYRSLTR